MTKLLPPKRLWLFTIIMTLALTLNLPLAFAKTKAAAQPPVLVNTIAAKTAMYHPYFEVTGSLGSNHGITVKAETAGRVTKIFFSSGQYVKANTPLVQIYPDVLMAQMKLAKAKLKLSKLNFQRYQKLLVKQAVSQQEYDQALATLETDSAQLQEIKAQLQQTLIRAPFSGYLGLDQIDIGDYLTPGQAIVNLEQTNLVTVKFDVPEAFMRQIHVGDKVSIHAHAYGSKIFTGKITSKESKIDTETRTLSFEGEIPNPNNELVPGSFVEVRVYYDKPQQLVSIPQTALLYSEKGEYVYKIINGKAIQSYVTLGKRGPSNVFITKGIQPNDQIVTVGVQKLFPGAKVKVVS
ncbi:MAG: efflux RND transporter periplasmic adaptor subunit [Pseudomonadota bacterium]